MPVKVRFLSTSKDAMMQSIVAEALTHRDDHKDAILKQLGMQRQEGESHLHAWLRNLAQENGVDIDEVRAAVRELTATDAELCRFIWIIA